MFPELYAHNLGVTNSHLERMGSVMNETELERISEHVKICQELIDEHDPHTPPELLFVLGVVEELAGLLGVTL